MIDLKKGEYKLCVKPMPHAAPELQHYIENHIFAKITYKSDGSIDWVKFLVANRRVWSCDYKYFINNFIREEEFALV